MLVGGSGKGLLDRVADVMNIDVLDPRTGAWSAAGALPEGRVEHTATALPDGRVLILGGRRAVVDGLAPALLWSPDGTVAPLGAGEARFTHTATALADGRVLVVGGCGARAIRLESAEIFDPATGLFTPAGRLHHARASHTATRLADGRVFVAGGESYAVVKECEIYDPVTNAWSAAGELTIGRFGHSATLLGDGGVLIAGGVTRTGRDHANDVVLDLAEVWTAGADAATTASEPGAIPPCPACGAKLFAARVVRERFVRPPGVAAGHWEFLVSCAKCLAGVKLEWSAAGALLPPSIEASGAVLARLREIFGQASADGRLQAEILRQLGVPDKSWMVGTPEVLGGIRAGLPKEVRLTVNARLLPPTTHRLTRPAFFANNPSSWSLEKLSVFLSRAEMSLAIKGTLPAGGFMLPNTSGASRFEWTIVLAGTPLAVTSVRDGQFLLSLPAFVQDYVGGIGSVVAPLGVVKAALDGQP